MEGTAAGVTSSTLSRSSTVEEGDFLEGAEAKLTVDLQQYAVLETRDGNGVLTIALLRKEAIRGADPTDHAEFHKSWYLTSYPVHHEMTMRWYQWLSRACALRGRSRFPLPAAATT